jgi:hypothetical protein
MWIEGMRFDRKETWPGPAGAAQRPTRSPFPKERSAVFAAEDAARRDMREVDLGPPIRESIRSDPRAD